MNSWSTSIIWKGHQYYVTYIHRSFFFSILVEVINGELPRWASKFIVYSCFHIFPSLMAHENIVTDMWKVSQIVRCYKETLLLRTTRHSVFRGEPTAFMKPNTMAGHSGPCSLVWVQMGIPAWLAVRGLNHNFVQKTLCPSEEQGTGRKSTWCRNGSVYSGMGEKQEQMTFGKYLLLQLIMPVRGEQFTTGWPYGAKRLRTQPPRSPRMGTSTSLSPPWAFVSSPPNGNHHFYF